MGPRFKVSPERLNGSSGKGVLLTFKFYTTGLSVPARGIKAFIISRPRCQERLHDESFAGYLCLLNCIEDTNGWLVDQVDS